jgi:hypothetical protein
MIIVLGKGETLENAYIIIKDLGSDPNKFDRVKKDLFHKTEIDQEELKLMVDIYIR